MLPTPLCAVNSGWFLVLRCMLTWLRSVCVDWCEWLWYKTIGHSELGELCVVSVCCVFVELFVFLFIFCIPVKRAACLMLASIGILGGIMGCAFMTERLVRFSKELERAREVLMLFGVLCGL